MCATPTSPVHSITTTGKLNARGSQESSFKWSFRCVCHPPSFFYFYCLYRARQEAESIRRPPTYILQTYSTWSCASARGTWEKEKLIRRVDSSRCVYLVCQMSPMFCLFVFFFCSFCLFLLVHSKLESSEHTQATPVDDTLYVVFFFVSSTANGECPRTTQEICPCRADNRYINSPLSTSCAWASHPAQMPLMSVIPSHLTLQFFFVPFVARVILSNKVIM